MDKLDELLNHKSKAKSLAIFAILFFVVAGVLFILGVMRSDTLSFSNPLLVLTMVSFVIGFILIIVYNVEKKEYTSIYKDTIVNTALSNILDDYKYRKDEGLPKDYIRSLGLIGLGDHYKSTDYIEGIYKDVDFRQADIHITRTETYTDSKGNTQTITVTIFKGKWSIYSFNKDFEDKVICVGNSFSDSRVGGLLSEYEKVKLESINFNENYKTYTIGSGHTAFYLLTPRVMEELLKLGKSYNNKVMYAFIDNNLHIIVNNGHDYFEPSSIFSDIDIDNEVKRIEKELHNSVVIVDSLKLNNKLFKGGNR